MATFIANLIAEVQVPDNGILSRTMYNDDHVRVVLFAFSQGQELTAHTAPMAATIHILQGEADLTLGEEVRQTRAGAFALMPPNLKHSVVARTPLVMLLTMVKQSATG